MKAKKAKPLRQFMVSVEMPVGATVEDVRAYIEVAVACWNGSFDPELPLFDLNRQAVKVKTVPQTRKPRKETG